MPVRLPQFHPFHVLGSLLSVYRVRRHVKCFAVAAEKLARPPLAARPPRTHTHKTLARVESRSMCAATGFSGAPVWALGPSRRFYERWRRARARALIVARDDYGDNAINCVRVPDVVLGTSAVPYRRCFIMVELNHIVIVSGWATKMMPLCARSAWHYVYCVCVCVCAYEKGTPAARVPASAPETM